VQRILKVSASDADEQELDFELAYQLTLSTAERFEMMLSRSRQIAEEQIRRGYRKPVEIIMRDAGSESLVETED
jgi:hypothetical protein